LLNPGPLFRRNGYGCTSARCRCGDGGLRERWRSERKRSEAGCAALPRSFSQQTSVQSCSELA
jgi:hypothetical protein